MADKTQNVKIDIRAETAKATSEIKRLNGELKKMDSEFQKGNRNLKSTTAQINQTSRSFASLTKHISQLAVIYGAFQGLQTTVRTFTEFEASVSRLGVISGATATEMKALRAEAERLGETTVFTASQVADGMNAMAMAGLTAQESLDGIASVLDLSALSLLSVEESALIATTAMNGFSLQAKDMGRISDVMAKTITTSAQNMTELGSAYEKVGSVATAFGVSLEETSASLGVLADAGRRGSEAGTQLKIVMSRLAGNKEAKKFLDELGISIYDANGNILPFTEQLKNVKAAMDKLPESARNIKMSEIFGTEALASANILLNKIDEVDSKVVELANSYGFASKSAKKMMDNLRGDWAEFNSALEGLIITIGTGLSPILRELLDDATEFIQSLDKEAVRSFGEGVGELVSTLGDLVKVIIDIGGVISDFSGAVREMTGISGSAQVQLLLLGVALSKLFTIAKGLDVAFVAMQASGGALSGVMAVASTRFASVNKLLGVMRASLVVLFNVIKANPIALAVTAVVGLGVAIGSVVSSNKEMAKTIKDASKQIENNGNVISTTTEQLREMDKVGREAFGDYIRREIDKTEKSLRALETALQDEADDWFVNKEAIAKMSDEHAKLTKNLDDLTAKEKEVVKVTAEVIAEEEEARRQAVKNIEAKEAEIKATEDLIKKREKELEQLKKNNATRIKSAEETLIKLYEDERKLVEDLADLEKELFDIRKKYADKRLATNDSLDDRLANARASGLNDYQKYLDAQERADEKLSKAKEARLKGDLDLANRYIDEYASLIEQSAGEEITIKKSVREYNKKTKEYETKEIDEIRVSREQNLRELQANTELEREFRMSLIEDEKNAEIQAHNLKIDNKLNELRLMKLSIQSQMEYIQNLAKIQSITSGIEVDLNFDSSMAQIETIDQSIEALANQKRTAEIEVLADASNAIPELNKLEDLAKNPVEKEITYDTTKAEQESAQLEQEEKKGEITKLVTVDLKTAEADLSRLQKEAETNTSAEHTVKVEKAQQAVDKLRALAEQNTSNTHESDTRDAVSAIKQYQSLASKNTSSTHTVYVKTVQVAQTGGLIGLTPQIPRFENGGSPLENGKGHTRRQGKLAGYGGGDKVKALLEAGEFIIRKEAVSKLGLDRLHLLNQGVLPKYQHGGLVDPIQRFNTGGLATKSSNNQVAGKSVELNLNLGGTTFKMMTDDEVASALERHIRKNS